MTPKLHLLLLLVCAELSACGGMTIRVPKMNPAEVNLAGYRRVGVGTIRGKGGEEIRADLTTALVRTGRFDVLERQELDALIEEQDLGASGRFDDETVASIGHLLGTAAIVLGAIGDADYTESLRREKKTCSRKERDPKTKKERTVNYRCDEYVRTARAALRANLKVVDTESGLVLAAKTLNSSVSDQAVDQFRKPAPFDAKETWLAQCRARIIAKFMRVIAPYETEVFVRLKEDGDLPQLERGNNYAKIGNWRAARDSYLAARAVATNDAEIEPDQRAKVLYNLGVAVGYSGSFDEAIQLLEESYILDPDSYTEREIHRMREFKLDAERLEKQRRGAVES